MGVLLPDAGLNIAPRTPKALEYSISYSFFHWGLSAWATYALASLIMAYHFHVRKNKGLSLSGSFPPSPACAPTARLGGWWT